MSWLGNCALTVRSAGLATLLFAVAQQPARADSTFVYAVQLNASVQSSPPQIVLTWRSDPYGATSYTVYRKAKEATSWGTGTTLPGWATSFTDFNVNEGSTYEYQVVKMGALGYKGYGYIYSGINASLIEGRGKLILIVASNASSALSTELARLESDLVGDGWLVVRHDVSSSDTPASVRNIIIADYNADPANVKAVFLLGHVPILHSGNLDYDGHLSRSMPADAYYADVNGSWNNPNYLPSDVELMVGRVDLWDMPGNATPGLWPNEIELLRNYLNKDHNWRHKVIDVPRRALMGNRRGDEDGEATATSGYRNFDPLMGAGNTVEANIEDNATADQRWISLLSTGDYLWAYGCGGGQNTSISALGLHGQYFNVWSTDLVGQDARAVFVLLFGSWLGNWDTTDNIMRSVLATPSLGLACAMAGRPHWFLHHMGLGEPIGYSARLTMNNSTLYRNESNGFPRAVYIALMGDPTLRLDPVVPPANVTAAVSPAGVQLNWSGSQGAVAGYHVYRAQTPAGPFSRLTSSLVSDTSFTDSEPGLWTYMVRAIKLQTTPSGTYFNPSQGIFATVDDLPIQVSAHLTNGNVVLSWNSTPGMVYHVLAANNPPEGVWTDISGSIMAGGTSLSWTDGNLTSSTQRFYRIQKSAH
jgi:hypothetical protein